MENIYDNEKFYNEYSKMERSQLGLEGAGEWEQLLPMFPTLSETAILDLGCGYGWHCAYAAKHGAKVIVEEVIPPEKWRNQLFNKYVAYI